MPAAETAPRGNARGQERAAERREAASARREAASERRRAASERADEQGRKP